METVKWTKWADRAELLEWTSAKSSPSGLQPRSSLFRGHKDGLLWTTAKLQKRTSQTWLTQRQWTLLKPRGNECFEKQSGIQNHFG